VRFALVIVLACSLLAAGCHSASRDVDGDGIPDLEEQRLAGQLFPALHAPAADACPAPLDPKPVLFRARHPSVDGRVDPSYIAINYVILFDADCGDGPHAGDDEPLVVFARQDANGAYVFDSLAATAHTHTAIELRTNSRSPDVWMQPNKHSLFADPARCPGCDPRGAVLRIQLFNAGEPDRPMISDLGLIARKYRGVDPWSPTARFFGAGIIGAEDLGLTYFTYLTRPPGAADARWDD